MKTLTTLSLALILAACGGAPVKTPDTTPDTAPDTAPDTTPPDTTPDTPKEANYKPGPEGFPLPLDADDGEVIPEGGGRMTMYKVPRGKVEVADELKATLIADGWEIVDEEVSPRGAIRINTSKDGRTFNFRLTGDDTQAALILTTPE